MDQIDEQLIRLLKRRLELGLRAARIKHDADLPIVDQEREAKVIAQAKQWADVAGLSEQEVADVFARLISLSRGAQLKSV
ncbi:MAG: chorismate mutase [Gemmatimonadales bacterium]